MRPYRQVVLGIVAILITVVTPLQAQVSEGPGCVILLHGLGRTKGSMAKMAATLAAQGYVTVNYDYPSTQYSIEQLASHHLKLAIAQCGPERPARVHFVTHSLGGIVVRQYLQTHSVPKGSRMVMLSPPNQGSEVADMLKRFAVYRWLMGPSAQQLGTHADSVPNQLKAVSIEIGVITGNKSLSPWFSALLPGADDGKVTVERAKLPEMQDFLVVPRTHTFIMRAPEVMEQVVSFLQLGHFTH